MSQGENNLCSHIPISRTSRDLDDLRCGVLGVIREFSTNFYLTGKQISSEDNFRLADELEVARSGQP